MRARIIAKKGEALLLAVLWLYEATPPRRAVRAASALVLFSFMTSLLFAAQLNMDWRQLPALPDPVGFAGLLAGVSDGALIVAGGANFPDKMPWEGGRKVWYDTVFLLERTNGVWREARALPRPLAYGVSITTPEGILCVGGSDATQHVRDVFLLSNSGGEVKNQELPSLPGPLANSCGALVGNIVYVAGGTESPDSTTTLNNFWSLDLRQRPLRWQVLEPWPGPGRMLSVAASVGGSFYLAGGASLAADSAGKPVRTYLRDAYRFTPGRAWTRVADMPSPIVAAPSPAPVLGDHSFLIVGGDDGSLAHFEPRSKHPGFAKRLLSYDTRCDRWDLVGETPVSRTTAPTAAWNGLVVILSGETRPGVRSPEVWALGHEQGH